MSYNLLKIKQKICWVSINTCHIAFNNHLQIIYLLSRLYKKLIVTWGNDLQFVNGNLLQTQCPCQKITARVYEIYFFRRNFASLIHCTVQTFKRRFWGTTDFALQSAKRIVH